MARGQMRRGLLIVLGLAVVVSWAFTIKAHDSRRSLAHAYERSQAMLAELEQERQRLNDQLLEAQQAMDDQSGELTTAHLEMARLQTLLSDAQQEIARLQTEQALLAQHTTDLTAQVASNDAVRQQLEARLSSMNELKLAIRSVKQKLRQERWQAWRALAETRRLEDQRLLAKGNRGFVVLSGVSTLVAESKPRTRLQVRVLEPETP